MTRKHILPIVAAIALIVGTLAFRLWPRTLKPEECSVLYQRYADSPDICATYIKNYRVNDTLTLNATLLEALTDSGWAELKHVLAIKEPDKNLDLIQPSIDNGDEAFTLIQKNPTRPCIGDLDIGVAARRDRYVCIFHMQCQQDKKSIFTAIMDLIFESLKNNINLTGGENNT